jgi:hypothetical protein
VCADTCMELSPTTTTWSVIQQNDKTFHLEGATSEGKRRWRVAQDRIQRWVSAVFPHILKFQVSRIGYFLYIFASLCNVYKVRCPAGNYNLVDRNGKQYGRSIYGHFRWIILISYSKNKPVTDSDDGCNIFLRNVELSSFLTLWHLALCSYIVL